MLNEDFLRKKIDFLAIERKQPKIISLEDNIDKRCFDDLDIATKKYDGALVDHSIENVEHKIFNEQLKETINSRLSTLSEEQAFVLTHFYGLNDTNPVSIAKIAKAMNVKEIAVLEKLTEAIKELRKSRKKLAIFL